MPATTPFVCIAAYCLFAVQHKWDNWRSDSKKGRRNHRRPWKRDIGHLLGGDLSAAVERAGIVDLRHLMIGEAENLAQDFVGMFAQQRDAYSLGRTVGHFDGVATEKYLPRSG